MKRTTNRKRLPQRRRPRVEFLEARTMLAGPYAPAAGIPGSTAIERTSPALTGWASAVVDYSPGTNVDAEFQIADRALGPAGSTADHTVSLGRGGSITLAFEDPIRDGLGFDFAVFENGISDNFLELAFVEVSSDGVNYFRFESDSLTPSPVDAFGAVDPTNVRNLAGKYRQGFGTPFDLEELRGVSPLLDTTRISHVRIRDIVGDGSSMDSRGRRIYDPYPTVGSAGFDLDAVGIIHRRDIGDDVISFEDVGATLSSMSAFRGPAANAESAIGPFEDTLLLGSFRSEQLGFNNAYSVDYGSWAQWAYSNVTNRVTPGFENQFGVIAGSGGNGTSTFGIGFADQSGFFEPPTIERPVTDARKFASLLVTNTTYAALSMKYGDAFAKKFGGASGNDPDYFLLTITGKNGAGQSIGSVDVYLADFRFTDHALDYIVEEWIEVDLSSIANARTLEFSVESSDVGPFGINTPAYFAIDEIRLTTPAIFLDLDRSEVDESDGPNAAIARVSRASRDATSAVTVQLSSDKDSVATFPATVTIPAGQPYVEFPVGVVDNDLVHGDREIVLAAEAAEMLGDERNLLVREDDRLALTLSFDSEGITEGGRVMATVTRNDANRSTSLQVQLQTIDESLFLFDRAVTIDAGKGSVSILIEAKDDTIDRPDMDVTFRATAAGYDTAAVSIAYADNDLPRILLEADSTNWNESAARPTIGLEDLGRGLVDGSFDNGADLSGGFRSSGLSFNNDYDPTFGSWSGWALSNTRDTMTPGFANQYSAFPGRGAVDSRTYAVASAFGYPDLPKIQRDPDNSTPFHSMEVTNTTYTALSMLQGDAFAKKFGGETGDDPDWLLLTIEGLDRDQASIGSVEFYLADYRFADNAMDYVVDQWTTVSLEPIAEAVELRFSLSSSDVGQFGMNTPAYFAADQIVLVGETLPPSVRVSRNTFDVSSELAVVMVSNDPSELRLPDRVLIPAGSSTVEVPIQIVNDSLFDGDQNVLLTASAEGFSAAALSGLVRDDEQPELTASIARDSMTEAGAGSHNTLLVHRNLADLSAELVVDIDSNPAHTTLPLQVTIPEGIATIAIPFQSVDNELRDGDRQVVIRVGAGMIQPGTTEITITDDEVSELRVEQSGETTSVDELQGEDVISVALASQPLSSVRVIVRADSNELGWTPESLTFTPENWEQPQAFTVKGVPDLLIEGVEVVPLMIEVDATSSDSIYALASPVAVEVTVQDSDPRQLRVRETEVAVVLVDEASGVEILKHSHANGIEVVANDREQSLVLGDLVETNGRVSIDMSGGQDSVRLEGTRFDLIEGGGGYDSLVLNLRESIAFGAFLGGRAYGFEEYILASDAGATLRVDSENLGSLAIQDGSILMRVAADQSIDFSPEAFLVDPRMRAGEFTQVVSLGVVQVHLIVPTPWQNILHPTDVNASGDVTSLDALAIINEMARRERAELPIIESLDVFTGFYFDVTADGLITALDALRVINELARSELIGESEQTVLATGPLDSNLMSTQPHGRVSAEVRGQATVDLATVSEKLVGDFGGNVQSMPPRAADGGTDRQGRDHALETEAVDAVLSTSPVL